MPLSLRADYGQVKITFGKRFLYVLNVRDAAPIGKSLVAFINPMGIVGIVGHCHQLKAGMSRDGQRQVAVLHYAENQGEEFHHEAALAAKDAFVCDATRDLKRHLPCTHVSHRRSNGLDHKAQAAARRVGEGVALNEFIVHIQLDVACAQQQPPAA